MMQMKFEDIVRRLEQDLPEKRMRHSLGVCEEAQKLARQYGADVEKARYAGVLHDCAKPLSADALFRECERFHIQLPPHPELQVKILHGPVGACQLMERFGIEDEEIFDAVYYHTTGKPAMPLLTKIVFLADYIDPNRTQTPALRRIRELAFEDLDAAVLLGLDTTILHLIDIGAPVYEQSFQARNYYLCERTGSLL